jgi:hypothetical protein
MSAASECYHGSVFVVIKNKLTFSDSFKLTPVANIIIISSNVTVSCHDIAEKLLNLH